MNRESIRILLAFAFLAISANAQSTEPEQIISQQSLTKFNNDLADGNIKAALEAGTEILAELDIYFADNAEYNQLKTKMQAAQHLAQQMIAQLKSAQKQRLQQVTELLFNYELDTTTHAKTIIPLTPADKFYQSAKQAFASHISDSSLPEDCAKFLSTYYQTTLRYFIARIAEAGRSLTIAEPDFDGTHDYILVLPLLNTPKGLPLRTDLIPAHLTDPNNLTRFSDSLLLNYSLPYQAMNLAQKAANARDTSFDPLQYYRNAANTCRNHQPLIAVECLRQAIELLSPDTPEDTASIHNDILNIYVESNNFTLAASEAKYLYQQFPNSPHAAEAIWLHHYALSRNSATQQILASIDDAITDPRAVPYKPQLLYLKWWALRRERSNPAELAALEYKLLKDYADSPLTAPIILSQATDSLASQDYDHAMNKLRFLTEKFPQTRAAKQAQTMADKIGRYQSPQ